MARGRGAASRLRWRTQQKNWPARKGRGIVRRPYRPAADRHTGSPLPGLTDRTFDVLLSRARSCTPGTVTCPVSFPGRIAAKLRPKQNPGSDQNRGKQVPLSAM